MTKEDIAKKKSAQKKKSKEYQWTHTISERKFNRCVDQYCVNIQKDFSGKGLDIYYNPETNTVYRGLYNCQDDIVFVAKHLDKCNDSKIVDFYKEMYEVYCPWENGDLGCDENYVEKVENENLSVMLSQALNEIESMGKNKFEDELYKAGYNKREVTIPEDIKNSKEGFVTLEESRDRRCGWTDKHYNFTYTLNSEDIKQGVIKIDPYFVNEVWELNNKDSTGIVFHCLKTLARWTDKNPEEREIRALYGQIKRLAEMRGVEL